MPPTTRRLSRAHASTALAWFISAGLLAAGTWMTYWAEWRLDAYQLLHLGQCIYAGGTMYRDCWENKPPGIAWVNALALAATGGRYLVAWILPAVTALLSLTAVYHVAKTAFGRGVAVPTLILGAVLFSMRFYDAPAIGPDYYGAILELASSALVAWAVLAPPGVRRTVLALSAGSLWAVAAGINPPAVVSLVIVNAAVALHAIFGSSPRTHISLVALVWLSFAAGVGAGIGVLAAQGTLAEARYALITFNRQWVTGSNFAHGRSLDEVLNDLRPVLPFLVLAAFGIAVSIGKRREDPRALGITLMLLAWWLVQLLLARMGPSRAARYWQATFPPLLWLDALAIAQIQDIRRRLTDERRPFFLAVIIAVLSVMSLPTAIYIWSGAEASYRSYASARGERNTLREIGRVVQQVVPPAERIYVWCDGEFGIYVHGRRCASCRFTSPRSPDQMREILDRLASGSAAALVVPQDPAAQGFCAFCDAAARQKFESILSGYQKRAAVAGFDLWLRRASP